MNEMALFKMSYGLYIVSSKANDKKAGCIVNTLTQITNTPNQICVSLSKESVTSDVIHRSKVFTGVALTMSADMDLIGEFGFKSSKDLDKFKNFKTKEDINGVPYILEHTSAYFSCNVVQEVDLGTHILFIGEVIDADVIRDEEVMTYAYYHDIKKGGTPKNAPSYREEKQMETKTQDTITNKKTIGWRCVVCGYIYEGDPLPEGYLCPICGVDSTFFERVEA